MDRKHLKEENKINHHLNSYIIKKQRTVEMNLGLIFGHTF